MEIYVSQVFNCELDTNYKRDMINMQAPPTCVGILNRYKK